MPDSDDESGFDSSQESEHEFPQQRIDIGIHGGPVAEDPTSKGQTIWDIPLSSQSSGKGNNVGQNAPQPLPTSQAPPPVPPPASEPEVTHDLDSSPLSSPILEPSDDLEDSIRTVGINVVELDTPQATEANSPAPPKQFVDAVFELEISDGDEGGSARGPSRLGRSLRPRKPIQEHPYLLESVQYSKTLRSHGVRPLRVQIEEAARRRQEEDSQEQEYEEETQSTVREIVQDDSADSQAIQNPGLLDDTDEEVAPAGSPSPRGGMGSGVLLGSSQNDEDEFPDPADVHKWNLGKGRAPTTKRQASPKGSRKRKLPKLSQPVRFTREVSPPTRISHIFDIPPSPPQTSPNLLSGTPVTAIRRSRNVTTLTPKPSSTISSRNQSPAPANQSTNTVDLTIVEDEDGAGSEQSASSTSDSESDSELQRVAMRRKMRGVLPASWLRLDQPGIRPKYAGTLPQRSPDRSPEPTQRKGVAQRRHISPKAGNDAALFLDDSDDDDDTTLRVDEIREFPSSNNNRALVLEDDAGSVIEDDHIDYMLPGNKRASGDTNGLGRPRKRRKTQQPIFTSQTSQTKRQQRITGLLNRTKSIATQSNVERHQAKSGSGVARRTKGPSRKPARTLSPPRLGILDVVESDAPPFIRIAARTARRRSDKGRSSPSRKQIALGTREDNIDAGSVLRDWKKGRIQPKASLNTAVSPPVGLPKPLHPISHNSVAWPTRTSSKLRPSRLVSSSRFSQSRRMVKQASIDGFVNVEVGGFPAQTQPNPTTSLSKRSQFGRVKSFNANSRPAQLETTGEKVGRYAFDARKKALDSLYRKSRRALAATTRIGLEQCLDSSVSMKNANQRPEELPSNDTLDNSVGPQLVPKRRRLKFRKHFQPRHLDTSAPQYAHANDPLPQEASPITHIVEVIETSEFAGKLLGLGPFGTHYTQHFEVFPLDMGVFFHESTLLGSGRLARALDDSYRDSLHRLRGRCTFILDEKSLQWGQWDAQISSELGIAFDWIVEHFHSESPDFNDGTSPVQAADFLLDYFQYHISFLDEESEKHFPGRALEILRSFAQRLEALPLQSQNQARLLVDVLSRSLIISLQILRVCHNLNQLTEIFQIEEVIGKIAKRTARELLEIGLADIRNLYYHLQRTSLRERGIRQEQYSTVCWVILIRVLEECRIPRSGFWDVVSSVMLGTNPDSINDAHTLERIWYDLFTLLPLGEFDNIGVLIPGIRHTIPLEGWTLPQRLLRRVFQLYESNSRQSPSFNDYCRGLVSRCHYLVEQWGWRRSNGIIGTIFDFFAARGLSHLRNEESYKSPEFLEHLTESPSLAIMPEDRCFHIFLKLVALSIKRLGSNGSTKDVRNLIARVLPNHNRQYEKEKDIHESELAALRNHHDLLCTLFWAAPASLRPSVQTIEKLVVPGSSHKEACLINLRAWSQLSRFVMSLNEDNSTYKPFADWQRNIFQQVMEQYLSAESDIQRQLLSMSKDASRNISRDMMNAVIKLNRKGAMDIIHFSMKGFLSVIRQAPTLDAVSFALNHYQLDQVFTRFPFSSADFDWGSLRVALDILDFYITRIEGFLNEGSVNADHSWHGEDAIMLLERRMAAPFFSMTRTVAEIDFRGDSLGPASDHAICVEQAVSLAGRLAARLLHARLSRVSQFFTTGKYSIFPTMPTILTSPLRKYHALFLSMLVEQGLDDFKDLGGSTLDLLLMELVKPLKFLAYENRLALAMRRRGDSYLRDAFVEIGNSPDYNSNMDLFSYVVAMMRKTLRLAEVNRKQQLQAQFSKTLRSTMDQIKLDLKSVVLGSPEHADYIEFVRSIVTVIRSQDLCPVDSYFYQISQEYSPSTQDPRLQIAGILSWGLKLEEGDTKAVPGLFYLLFPNFKLALANGKLANERVILQQGMGNSHVFSFIMSAMFPAIIKTAVQMREGWIILDTYVAAIEETFLGPCIHKVLDREDVNGLLIVLNFILAGIRHLQTLGTTDLHPEHVHTLVQITRLLNLFSPSLAAYIINESTSQLAVDITKAMGAFTNFTRKAGRYLSNLLEESKGTTPLQPIIIDPNRLFGAVEEFGMGPSLERNENISRFANHMIRDINDNWTSDGSSINVKGPSRASSTQSGQGTLIPRWEARDLIQSLEKELREWNYNNDMAAATSRLAALPLDEYLF